MTAIYRSFSRKLPALFGTAIAVVRLLEYCRRQPRYQTRINAILRAATEHEKKAVFGRKWDQGTEQERQGQPY